MPATPPPDAARILEHLGPYAAGFAIEVAAECASTNDALAADEAPSDARLRVLVAAVQHAGRGRRGRSWTCAPGQGLTFSCAWPLDPAAGPPAGLSLAVGLAVAEAVEGLGVRGVGLKWPNDVLVDGRKLAGILVELASGQRRTRRAVIGIGLNLVAQPFLPEGAIALSERLDTAPDPERVLAALLLRLQARLEDFRRSGFAALRAAWQRRDAFAGRHVRITGEQIEQLGICDGVADDGALLLRGDSGVTRILSGEVSLRAAA